VTSDNIVELVIELVKLLLKREILATMTSCVDLDFCAWQFKALYNIIAPLCILFPQVTMSAKIILLYAKVEIFTLPQTIFSTVCQEM